MRDLKLSAPDCRTAFEVLDAGQVLVVVREGAEPFFMNGYKKGSCIGRQMQKLAKRYG